MLCICAVFLNEVVCIKANFGTTFDVSWELITSEPAIGITISPDNNYIAFGDPIGNQLSIFNIQTRTIEKRINFPETFKEGITFIPKWSPDRLYIAVSTHGVVHIIDLKDGKIVQSYSKKMSVVSNIEWIDSSHLAILDPTGYIDIFEIGTGKTIQTIDLGMQGESISYETFDWNAKNSLLAIPLYWSNTIGFLDKDGSLSKNYTYTDIKGHPKTSCFPATDEISQIHSITWSPNGENLSLTAKYGMTICSFGTKRKLVTQTIDNDSTSTAAWSPDSHWLISTNAYDPTCWIKVFDATQAFVLNATFEGNICGIYSIDWSRDGSYIVAGGTTELWIGTVK